MNINLVLMGHDNNINKSKINFYLYMVEIKGNLAYGAMLW